MMAAFDVGIRLAGLLVSTYAIAAAVASFTLGPVSDLWGRRRLLLIGLAVFAVGTLLWGLATSYATMLVFRALTGVAAGTLSLNFTAFIGDYFSYGRRGVAMGMVMSGYFAAL
ncbi:MAG: MFS transporter [Gemmatimonadota bacterium]|nr:MFS transporter [Gemmatimonadota bacterium]